jgi:nucleotide-binding universal stress UspA family protein
MPRSTENAAPLLVGVSNPETADRLVQLASILEALEPREIILTHVATVATQISLTTGQSSPEVVRARDFLQDVMERARAAGVNARALVEVARTVDEGLLAAAESHQAGMVLMGYSDAGEPEDTGKGEERFDRTMHRVARRADADVVGARFRGTEMNRILVPVTEEAPLQVAGLLCRALGRAEGVELTFFHVVEAEDEKDQARDRLGARLEERGVAALGRLQVVVSEDLVERIVEEAHQYDLVVVGPSGRPGVLEAIFSSRASRIAEESPATVLMAWNRTRGDD